MFVLQSIWDRMKFMFCMCESHVPTALIKSIHLIAESEEFKFIQEKR